MVEWEVLWCVVVEADADQHLSRRRSQLSLPRSRVGLTFAGLMEEWDSDRVQSAGVSVRCTAASLCFSYCAVRAVCTRRRQDHLGDHEHLVSSGSFERRSDPTVIHGEKVAQSSR